MTGHPLISFKAGKCLEDFTTSPPKIKPLPEQGWITVFYDDEELSHLCWRGRNTSLEQAELDLAIVPGDITFAPYTGGPDAPKDDEITSSPASIKGRIFKLSFLSSSARHFFWLQSQCQYKDSPSRFSERDLRLGEIVNALLNDGGEPPDDIDIQQLREDGRNGRDDDDTAMGEGDSDNRDASHGRRQSGGAGAGATGGDVREEGEESREGGADGGRAASGGQSSVHSQTQNAVQNFLKSLQSGGAAQQQESYTTLPDLLPTSITIPILTSLPEPVLDTLLVKHLPHSLIYLALDCDPNENGEDDEEPSSSEDSEEAASVLVEGLSLEQKQQIIERVARSPQFHQALMSLTGALRDGGLPGIADALGVQVENNGYYNAASGVAMSGGQAVRAFVEGIRKKAEKESK